MTVDESATAFPPGGEPPLSDEQYRIQELHNECWQLRGALERCEARLKEVMPGGGPTEAEKERDRLMDALTLLKRLWREDFDAFKDYMDDLCGEDETDGTD